MTMAFRLFGSVMSAGIIALATVIPAQNAMPTASNPKVKIAQGAIDPKPTDAPANTSRSKTKKAKSHKNNGNGGVENKRTAPTGGTGTSDAKPYQ
jgi:hypothetical protein